MLSSDQLLAVLSDILDFSKIESGRFDLESEPVSVHNMIEEACDIAAPRAREKGIELIVDVAGAAAGGPPPAILGDVTRLRQILINLINNAVKFTEHGAVSVHSRLAEPPDAEGRALIEFSVHDTGIGIPPERVGALFQAFMQVDASTTRKYGGTGLGLAVCKRLVELMGGEISVTSRLGKGAVFSFTVRAARAEQHTELTPLDAAVLQDKRAGGGRSPCQLPGADAPAAAIGHARGQCRVWRSGAGCAGPHPAARHHHHRHAHARHGRPCAGRPHPQAARLRAPAADTAELRFHAGRCKRRSLQCPAAQARAPEPAV